MFKQLAHKFSEICRLAQTAPSGVTTAEIRGGEKVDYSLEAEIWKQAQIQLGEHGFAQVIESAVDSYRRRPGHSPLERIHVTSVGARGLLALRNTQRPGENSLNTDPLPPYATVRAAFRAHIYYALQFEIMQLGAPTDLIAGDQLARDMGL